MTALIDNLFMKKQGLSLVFFILYRHIEFCPSIRLNHKGITKYAEVFQRRTFV